MKLATLITKARARYGSNPPAIGRIVSDLRCGWQAACRVSEALAPARAPDTHDAALVPRLKPL